MYDWAYLGHRAQKAAPSVEIIKQERSRIHILILWPGKPYKRPQKECGGPSRDWQGLWAGPLLLGDPGGHFISQNSASSAVKQDNGEP